MKSLEFFITFAVVLLTFVSAQDSPYEQPPPGHLEENPEFEQPPPLRPHFPGNVIEMTFDYALRAHVLDDDMNLQEPMIIVWTHTHNNVSILAASEIAKLANLTMDQPKVVRADCLYDIEPCDLMISHMEAYIQNKVNVFPILMMVEKDFMYLWEGPIVANNIYNDFVKDK